MSEKRVETDVILSGGGVLCVALAGALDELARSGCSFVRIAGNSGGSIAGSLLAAMEASGTPVEGNLVDLVYRMPFETFRQVRTHHMLKPLAEAHNLVRYGGVHDGSALRDWIDGALEEFGVHTFSDLALPAACCEDIPPDRRYRLVVTASDVSTATPALFPWDDPRYGVRPGSQPVADAVRMSLSVPYYFTPVRMRDDGGQVHTLVDGFLFTNYPAGIFDPPVGVRPPRQVIGINLSGILPHDDRHVHQVKGPLSLGRALVTSLVGALDSSFIDDPQHVARTISVPAMECGVHIMDFDLTRSDKRRLIDSGRRAAAEFLATWDFGRYCEEYYAVPAARSEAGR